MYTTYQHPQSGEVYAVAMQAGKIVQAAGPLHSSEIPHPPHVERWVEDYLGNQVDQEALYTDGAWLESE